MLTVRSERHFFAAQPAKKRSPLWHEEENFVFVAPLTCGTNIKNRPLELVLVLELDCPGIWLWFVRRSNGLGQEPAVHPKIDAGHEAAGFFAREENRSTYEF